MDSGRKINYSLRPSKGVERKMICDLLLETNKVIPIIESRYIGFGSFYFSDFILFHKALNINDMISIEKDASCKKRCDYNKPYSNIAIYEGQAFDVFGKIEWGKKRDIIWLDYDSSFNGYMLADVESVINKTTSGSIFFISFNTSLNETEISDSQNKKTKLDILMDRVDKNYLDGIDNKDLTNKNISTSLRKILDISIKKAIIERNSGIDDALKCHVRPIAIFEYKDNANAPMSTIGYLIATDAEFEKYHKCNFSNCPWFSEWKFDKVYKIECPWFTKYELRNINKKLPILMDNYETQIKSLYDEFSFIDKKSIEQYIKIYRYYPHYFEGFDNI